MDGVCLGFPDLQLTNLLSKENDAVGKHLTFTLPSALRTNVPLQSPLLKRLYAEKRSDHRYPPDDFVERPSGRIGKRNNDEVLQPHVQVASGYKITRHRNRKEVENVEGGTRHCGDNSRSDMAGSETAWRIPGPQTLRRRVSRHCKQGKWDAARPRCPISGEWPPARKEGLP